MKKAVFFIFFFCLSSTIDAQNKYAVLITGDYRPNDRISLENQWNEGVVSNPRGNLEFWHDTYLMWEMLQDKGFKRENIFVVFADGADYYSSNPRYQPPTGYTVTNYPADFSSIKSVFDGLRNGIGFPKVTEDDFLFVWTFSHGTHELDNHYGILLLNDDVLRDDTLSSWIDDIPAYKKAFWMQQCHGGGFATALQANNVVFNSACQSYELAHPADDYTIDGVHFIENDTLLTNLDKYVHGEFDYHLISVCNGCTPTGQLVYDEDTLANGDLNNDSFISLYEASVWESSHESIDVERGDTPFYSDLGGIGVHSSLDYPTLLFDHISNNETHRGIIGISKDLYVTEGQTLTITGNSVVTLCNNAKIIIENGGNLVINGNVSFYGTNDNILEIHGNFTNNSSDTLYFNNMQVEVTSESFTIGKAAFNDTELKYEPLSSSAISVLLSSGSITIRNCRFTNNNKQVAICVKNSLGYFIDNNKITSSLGNGIYIMNSGNTSNAGNTIRKVSNNTVYGCIGTGLVFYASSGDVTLNNVYDNTIGVKLLNNCNIHNFTGRCSATAGENTQYIHDNDSYEIYLTSNCAPQRMQYNLITDGGNTPYIYYDGNVAFGEPNIPSRSIIDVKRNAWGSSFVPSTHLYSTSSTVTYDYLPYWSMGTCFDDWTEAQQLIATADSLCELGEYVTANNAYRQVVNKHPHTPSAATALKSLLSLEKEMGQDFAALQQYYLTDSAIMSDTILCKLAYALSNKCDLIMGNYADAIAWYEGAITNPNTTYCDSVFATIDLGNLYLELQNIGLKGSLNYSLNQFIPKSKELFTTNTDKAIASLPRTNNRDCPYWTDIVTQQPEGYVELESGDVEISSAEGLAWLISVVNGLNGCVADNLEGHSVKLMSDVDLSEGEWTPIGDVYSDSTLVFKGLFDGMRHTIENLFIHDKSYSKQYLGFFGCLSQAEVHNLYLDQGRVFGGAYCGGIAGWSDNGSLVDNCVVNLKVGADFYLGGVVGRNRNSTIRNCCYIYDSLGAWDFYSGGIAGRNEAEGQDAVIENSYYDSELDASLNTGYTGGIVGLNDVNGNDGVALIKNCYAALHGTYRVEAGISGRNLGGEVLNCYYKDDYEGYDVPVIGNGDANYSDCSAFSFQEGVGAVLDNSVSVGGCETNILLEALNLWRALQNPTIVYNDWCEEGELPFFCDQLNEMEEQTVQFSEVTISPNPSSNLVRIDGMNVAELRVCNILGQTLKTIRNSNTFSVSGLPAGLYLLRMTGGEGMTVTKRIVVK